MRPAFPGLALAALALTVAACGESSQLPDESSIGPNPTLPAPTQTILPTVRVAKAVGWQGAAQPVAAEGLVVKPFARNLDHPRWLYALPNGDVLVAESNAPKRADGGGVKAFVMGLVQGYAGAKTPSANRISLLRDSDGDGIAETKTTFLENLHSPFGMALVGDSLYVANTDAILRFPYAAGATRITAVGTKVADLPAGPINHHWTKGLVASRDGKLLYASIGSNSNVAENGIEHEERRAAILEVDIATGQSRVFAAGLRNPVGMDWEPQTGTLWAVVNERDELGSDLVPDYLTSVKEGAFYGWPWSYYGQNIDARVKPENPGMVAKAIVPDYALGNHVAPLGLAFSSLRSPERFTNGAFVGEHGSWNRDPPSGYKVVFVPFRNGRPDGMPIDVLTGFRTSDGKAQGRPVGVALHPAGALLVADDVGNVVWRVASDPQRRQTAADRSMP